MIEIGRTRSVAVRRKVAGRLQPTGETKIVSRQIWAVTKDELGGHFGPDARRKLIVGLTDGDVLVMYPKGTRQRVSATLKDVYRFLIQCRANRTQLEKARERKARLAEQRDRRNREAAEKRLRRKVQADKQTEGWVNVIRKQK